ncbi:MAG: ROK family transcriptional regulator [Halanaerobiaceae bacterium]
MYNSLKPSHIREANMKQIIRLIRTSEEKLSRADISRKVSLSAPSVSKIINILLEAGILEETEEGSSGSLGGRKPILLDIKKDCSYILGTYIEEEQLTFVVADFGANIIDTVSYNYEVKEKCDCINLLIEKINMVLSRNKIEKEKLLSIGISVPGVFDPEEGIIKFAPNIEIWEDIALKKKLNQEFDCQVSVENAVNAAVLGEKWQGKLNGCKNAIYLKLDKGIGAGILINNSLYRGGNSIAGEVGYMVSDKEYISSQKNGYGSLESVCSTKFIVKKAEKILGKDNISFEVVIDEIKKGNKKLKVLIEEINELIAVAIANIICVINPEKVVLGGEFTEIAQSYKTDIMEIISRIVPSVPKLIFSELGNKVFYLGAIVQGLENIEENLVYQYFEKTN